MSGETLQHVTDWVDSAAPVDISAAYATWTELVGELTARIEERFTLERDPSVGPWESFSGNGQATGSIKAYVGPEIDWYVDSYIHNPDVSFCNLHVTVWLGPQVRVPHFGFAVACFPDPWAFCDLLPRADLIRDGDYFDRYYASRNADWVQPARREPAAQVVHQPRRLRPGDAVRRPRSATPGPTRSAPTPSSATTPTSSSTCWFGYLDEAEPVPAEEQAALAAADRLMRKNVAERDPANVDGRALLRRRRRARARQVLVGRRPRAGRGRGLPRDRLGRAHRRARAVVRGTRRRCRRRRSTRST